MKPAIFISIPRCASTSINNIVSCRRFNHQTAKYIKNKMQDFDNFFNYDNYNNYFSFAIVRNPYDIVASWYAFHQAPVTRDYYEKTFTEWVLNGFKTHWNNIGTGMQFTGAHPLNQWEYVYDGAELIVDFVGRFENLDEDWKFICKKLGINEKLKKLNQTWINNYEQFYDKNIKKIVYNKFEKDFVLFDYEK